MLARTLVVALLPRSRPAAATALAMMTRSMHCGAWGAKPSAHRVLPLPTATLPCTQQQHSLWKGRRNTLQQQLHCLATCVDSSSTTASGSTTNGVTAPLPATQPPASEQQQQAMITGLGQACGAWGTKPSAHRVLPLPTATLPCAQQQHSLWKGRRNTLQQQWHLDTCVASSSTAAAGSTSGDGVTAPLPATQPPASVQQQQVFPAAMTGVTILGQASPRVYSSSIQGDQNLLQQLLRAPAQYAQGHDILDSIVKVYTVHSRPNNFMPWQNHPKRESTGTGFVVHDRLILTNAHCIADATYVTVKRHGSGTRYRAHVQAVGHDCDLAILSVEDDAFWAIPTVIKPLALGPLPALQQSVIVVGYPTGGDNTSITSGVVSRVEVAQYVHSASHLMAIQIDAAINAGNSGGPALQGDEVVGVAFQNLPNADNIGFIIPTPVVNHFLSEVARYGQYRGYCSLGVMCQSLENPHLRKALAMPSGTTGVLINSVQQTSTAAQFIKRGDVLMEFNGVPIASDGTVHLRQRERIYFSFLITLLPTGAKARVKLLRQGQVVEEDLVVQPNDLLVPVHTYDRQPIYFIYAGLVFIPLNQPYLMEYGDDWVNTCPRRLYDKAMHNIMSKPGQQIVIMSQVLVDDVNTGYQQLQNLQVLAVNGTEVLNLAHLTELVKQPCPDGYVRFELEDHRLIAVDASLADSASHRVAERYRIPTLSSASLAAALTTVASVPVGAAA